MALLAEYALTPDVFDATSYSNDEVGGIQLQHLKEVLLTEGLVRDLRDGQWFSLFTTEERPWHMRGKELLKKLVLQKRLRRCVCARANTPATDCEWCEEALASHAPRAGMPLAGIVTTRAVAAGYRREQLVASVDQLATAPWWAGRSPSVRLARTIADYSEHLRLVLHCANSVMFIDPHLDPSQRRYSDVITLLQEMSGRTTSPRIAVHRVCYVGSGQNRQLVSGPDWESRFRTAWGPSLQAAGLSVDVYIWDDFHDRYAISDLVGISVPNGFDTIPMTNQLTTWNRLGRPELDDVEREFHPNSHRHSLRHRFPVGRTR